MIRVGTAGWHYADWNGIVYPSPRPRGFDPLACLSRIFDAVEVNVTFYRIPGRRMVEGWVRRTAANPSFRFTIKLPRAFTHAEGEDLDAAEKQFREAIEPVRDAGILGAVLMQFPQSFHQTPATEARLAGLLDRFVDLPCVVEVRHAGWARAGALRVLAERGAGFCNIDQPRLGSTLPPTDRVMGRVGYVRLHGRNAAQWFRKDAGVTRRYDYLYTMEELAEWVDAARRMSAATTELYVIANNHFRGKAAVNALQIRAALEGGKVEVPETLLAAYPELASIARPPEGLLPF